MLQADGTPMANAMLTVLHSLGMDDMKSFGDSQSLHFAIGYPF